MSTVYYSDSNTNTYSMTKVFGWMFYAILLTAATAFGLPYLLVALNATELYIPILIGGVIAVFILCFLGQFLIARAKSKATAITIFSLFAVAMGTWISPLMIIYELGTIVYSLAITAGVFGIMAVYGLVTKRDLDRFGSFLVLLLLGALLVSIVNIFIANSTLDWVLSYVILGIYIGFIAYDVQRVKQLAQSGQLTMNISLLMALNLYIDFVYIFIRILSIVARSRD